MPRQILVLKISGDRSDIRQLILLIEKGYFIVSSSPLKMNDANQNFHQYLSILPKNGWEDAFLSHEPQDKEDVPR